MNSTNRFLNRAFLFVVGLVLLAAGALLAVGALVPDLQQPISDGAQDASGRVSDTFSSNPWILWVAAVVALILVVILLWFVLRQGRGRTSTLVRVRDNSHGTATAGGAVVVDVKVAAQLLEDALSQHADIASVDVVAFDIRHESVLRITAFARRGASPVNIRSTIDDVVAEWDAALGTPTPVMVQIVSGLRTAITKSTARVA